MDPLDIRYLIAFILLFSFLVETVLDFVNHRSFRKEMPEGAGLIYEENSYNRAYAYHQVNFRFGLISTIIETTVLLMFLLAGGFGFIDLAAQSITFNPLLQTLVFFAILAIASDLLRLPFSLYRTFIIEEKFGFNKTTVRTFILDKLKSYLLGALIGAPLLLLITWIYDSTGDYFWLLAFGVAAVFSIFFSVFYTSLLLPVFNKLRPLEDGPLREAITTYCQQNEFQLDRIFVIDGSRRSSRANAFFSGLGPKKSIVLYDTLIEKHTIPELVAVLAHEVGHYKHRHTIKGLITGLIQMAIIFLIMGWALRDPGLSLALGGISPNFHLGLVAFGLLLTPVNMVTGTIANVLSRKHEYQADAFAASTYSGEDLASALIKLSSDNLVNPRPHPAYVFIHYSHPPMLSRLEHLKKVERDS